MKIKIITLFAIIFTTLSCNNTKKTNSIGERNSDMETENVITDKYCKLVTLEGQAVTMDEGQEKEVFFTIKSNDKTVNGLTAVIHSPAIIPLKMVAELNLEHLQQL